MTLKLSRSKMRTTAATARRIRLHRRRSLCDAITDQVGTRALEAPAAAAAAACDVTTIRHEYTDTCGSTSYTRDTSWAEPNVDIASFEYTIRKTGSRLESHMCQQFCPVHPSRPERERESSPVGRDGSLPDGCEAAQCQRASTLPAAAMTERRSRPLYFGDTAHKG